MISPEAESKCPYGVIAQKKHGLRGFYAFQHILSIEEFHVKRMPNPCQ